MRHSPEGAQHRTWETLCVTAQMAVTMFVYRVIGFSLGVSYEPKVIGWVTFKRITPTHSVIGGSLHTVDPQLTYTP